LTCTGAHKLFFKRVFGQVTTAVSNYCSRLSPPTSAQSYLTGEIHHGPINDAAIVLKQRVDKKYF